MKSSYPLYLLSILAAANSVASSDDNSCDIDGGKNDCNRPKENNKYSEETNVKWRKHSEELEATQPEAECVNDAKTCNCYKDLITKDLAPFPVVTREDLAAIAPVQQHAVTYQLVDGQLFRSRDCLFPFRCKGVEHFILELAEELPNFELVMNMHDWPYINKHFKQGTLPLFSFSKTEHYWDISYPAWTFWAGGPAISLYPTGLGRWDLLRKSLQKEHKKLPWADKKDKSFFRGSRTSSERDSLVRLSRKRPNLADAGYTKNQAWKSTADTLGAEPVAEVSLESHCNYRYLFNFRGVAASFRFKHLFLCGSTVLHVGSDWTEFFYPLLKPWVHYVPVDAKASEGELEELLLFLKSVPEQAERIASRGRVFIEKNLRMEDVKCYWKELLTEYARRLDFVPVRNKDLIQIKT